MKIKIVVLVIMFSVVSLAGAEEWSKWNIAPYTPNLLEACKKAHEAVDGFTLPSAVKDHFKKVGDICKDSTEAWLTPKMRLEEMWSGGRKPHVMKGRIVGELPVLKSPDGRSYRKGSVAETAKALSWSFTYEGKTYILYLPFVCFNWSWGLAPPQSPIRTVSEEQCLTLEYVIEPGDEVRFAVLARKRLPASGCWQLCDGDDCAAPPSPCDTCDWTGPRSVIPTGFWPLHTGRYVARDGKQSLRFPLDVQSEYVALCVTRRGAQSNSWVVQPTAWVGRTTVSIPYGGQEWPSWGMDKIDWSKWPRGHD